MKTKKLKFKKPVFNKKNAIKYLSFAFVLLFTIFLDINTNNIEASESNLVYKVYLDEELIGVVKDASFINNYMDKKKEEYQSSHGINKVYTPEDLVVVPEYHENANLTSENEVLQIIKDNAKFKVDGYVVEIKREVYKKLEKELEESDELEIETVIEQMTVLDRDDFEDSLQSYIKLFVDEDDYNRIMNKEELPNLNEEEKILFNFYLDAEISIYATQVEVADVLKSKDEIVRYLLYNTSDVDKLDNVYVVKKGDDIREIAIKNRLTVNELILINDSIKNENTLLTQGQELYINEPKPMLSVITEEYLVTRESIPFSVKVIEDPTRYTYKHDYTKQRGVAGERKVKYLITSVNGESLQGYEALESEVTLQPIPKIIVEGTKVSPHIGTGTFRWPTNSWHITAHYGWYYPFGYKMWHKGMDITGVRGSAIYAVDNGVVEVAGWHPVSGWWVIINHNNGYKSTYGHMNSRPYVKKGDVVPKGATIGGMGKTGMVTGVHLHIEISYYGVTKNPYPLLRGW